MLLLSDVVNSSQLNQLVTKQDLRDLEAKFETKIEMQHYKFQAKLSRLEARLTNCIVTIMVVGSVAFLGGLMVYLHI